MMLGWRLQCREPMCASLHVCALHPECGLSVWGNSGPCCAIGRGLTLGAGARLVAFGYQLLSRVAIYSLTHHTLSSLSHVLGRWFIAEPRRGECIMLSMLTVT